MRSTNQGFLNEHGDKGQLGYSQGDPTREGKVAPKLSSLQMFVAGLVLAGLGTVATLFGTEVANGMIGPEGAPPFFALRAADLLAQILLTLGLVLVAVSPLARMMERPPKRPDEHTVLLRETLDRRRTR